MKKLAIVSFLWVWGYCGPQIVSVNIHNKNNAVIPEYSGGRFGDNLLAVANALYVAIKNDCKLFLPPFPYSDQLMMGSLLPTYNESVYKNYKQRFYHLDRDAKITYRNPHDNAELTNTLFIVPFFPHMESVEYMKGEFCSFFVNWEESSFKNKLRALIAPKKPLPLITPPRNKLSVAVHVRKGGDFDKWVDKDRVQNPITAYRSPLDDYYIEQIKTISSLFNKIPLYVFIFTDDKNPKALVEKYKQAVALDHVEFDYHKEHTHKEDMTLVDFFSMVEFTILIRPQSNFSVMAEQVGSHDIVISPGMFKEDSPVQGGTIQFKKPYHDIVAYSRQLTKDVS